MNGFAGVESGSQSYMSGLLGFDNDDNCDYDETTENDLEIMSMPNFDVILKIKEFLLLVKNDPDYAQIRNSVNKKTQKLLLEINN